MLKRCQEFLELENGRIQCCRVEHNAGTCSFIKDGVRIVVEEVLVGKKTCSCCD